MMILHNGSHIDYMLKIEVFFYWLKKLWFNHISPNHVCKSLCICKTKIAWMVNLSGTRWWWCCSKTCSGTRNHYVHDIDDVIVAKHAWEQEIYRNVHN